MKSTTYIAAATLIAMSVGGCSVYRGVGNTLASLKARGPIVIETAPNADAATQELASLFARAINRTPDMMMSGPRDNALTVTLNPLDDPRASDGRTDLRATASYRAADGRTVTTSNGRCFSDQLQRCADQLVREARFARLKL